MQSPPAEWALFVGHFAVLDYLRSRGEADHDTASETLRTAVARIPHGRWLFTAGVVVGAVWFHEHIVGPLR